MSSSASDSTPAIVTTGLGKRFGERRAVDGIDLEVRRGSVYGLLGPNGAGKTTTVRLLATLLSPSSGRALVLGHDVVREAQVVRRKISLTGQFASVDEDLTGHENLVLLSRLLGLARRPADARADELLAAFDLSDVSTAQVKTYSGGMRRRLDIAASLIRTPELLFLDEPTTGLDPRSRGQVWEIVRSLVSHGTTVLLTTQYLEEADQLADRIAVIDRGKVIAEGTSSELKASIGRGVLHVRLVHPSARAAAFELLKRRLGNVQSDPDPRALSAAAPEALAASAALQELLAAGIEVAEFSLGQPSLDEVFFALTGRASAREAAGAPRTENGS